MTREGKLSYERQNAKKSFFSSFLLLSFFLFSSFFVQLRKLVEHHRGRAAEREQRGEWKTSVDTATCMADKCGRRRDV